MPRTPKRLYGPAQVATGPATIYTVPSLTKTIIRQIHIQNPSASAVTYTLSIGADAAGTRWFDTFSIPAKSAGVTDSVRDHFMYLVLDAAEILQIAASAGATLVVTVTGDEYTPG
jgi:hypothetical protein